MANYLDALERGYVGSNPFHNNVHAADVMFTLNFLGRPLFREMVGPLDKFGALLAALAHDFAHPGVSNAFLMTTRSEEAVLYNDQSVLEMFHAAGSWRLLLTSSECNVTEGFTPEMYKQMRETHIAMILATDLKVHCRALCAILHPAQFCATLSDAALLTQGALRALGAAEDADRHRRLRLGRAQGRALLLGQALHAADISNPAKAQHLQIKWTQRVMKEFFLQGDRENELGLPISAFMDRQKTSIAQCQMGFISVLVKPLYAEWRKLLGDDLQPAIDLLQLSLSGWETDGNKLCEGWDL